MNLQLVLLAGEEGGGFNPLDLSQGGGLFWTVVIFAVALVPIWKLVMGPITRGLAARDDKVTSSIAAAEKAAREAESALADVASKLREAQVEAAKIVDGARGRAEVVERQLKDEAAKQASSLLERAKAEIRSEQDKALSAIRREVVEVSINAAGQVLKRRVDSNDDRRLVEELVTSASKSATERKT